MSERGKPNVICPHPVLYFDKGTETRRWKFSIEPIQVEYGPLVCLVDDADMILNFAAAKSAVSSRLRSLAFDPELDYFLAAGDMTMYGLMIAVSMLEYARTPRQHRFSQRYQRYNILPSMEVAPDGVTLHN